ncbi:MAG TPA: hypothetical protein VJ695_02895 [Nitrososphaera sp.]|nr:hypothetical protein [Nitrososphaera sp.]
MAFVSFSAAARIVDEILSISDGILAVSIIDERRSGEVLASKSKESFDKEFGVYREGPKYGGTLAIAMLSIANEVREIAGEAKAIMTTYDRCKMMLLRMKSHGIMVGLVLQSSVNAEDYNNDIGNKIEGLLAGDIR